jgi:hypothetical protein
MQQCALLTVALVAVGCGAHSAPDPRAVAPGTSASAAAQSSMPPEAVSPRARGRQPVTPPDPLPAVELARLRYVFLALDSFSKEWPWLATDRTCVFLIGSETQWVVNCDAPPANDFETLASVFRGRAVYGRRGGTFDMNGDELSAAAFIRSTPATASVPIPASQGLAATANPWILVSTIDALIAFHPAFGPDTTTEEWMGVFVHEFFHTRQLLEPHFSQNFPDVITGALDRDALVALYESNVAYRAAVEQEYALLVAAAANPEMSGAEARSVLRKWANLHAKRQKLLRPPAQGEHLQRADVVYTYVEGVARYVENRFLVDAAYHPAASVAGDPRFSRFNAHEHKGYEGMMSRKLGPRYFYALGMHLALLLDRIAPDWKQRVHAEPDLLIGLALKLLATETARPLDEHGEAHVRPTRPPPWSASDEAASVPTAGRSLTAIP